MVHVHACVRSEYVAQTEISVAARHAGFGRVAYVQAAGAGLTAAGARYASKAARYTAKALNGYPSWLHANGGKRPWHWSRGYTSGTPMREWIQLFAPAQDPGPWSRVRTPVPFPREASRTV